MNKVILIGNLTKAVEIRFTQTKLAIANFTIAVSRETKNKDGNYESDFINCIAFGKTAEMMNKYLDKGSKIMVEGHIQTGSYEKDGKRIYTTNVAVERVEFVDKLSKEKQMENKTDAEIIASVVNEEQYQLPF